MNNTPVTQAVIAAAGFGTRFLPQTKAMPKEMLPIVDKPVIQYIVEQLVEAGICDIIIVTGSSKRPIEDHFDAPNADLLDNLRAGGPKKQPYVDMVEAVGNLANFAYVRQKGPYGTGTPIMNAQPHLRPEPFIYTFADDITLPEAGQPNIFQQLINAHHTHGGSIIPTIEARTDADFDQYGILEGRDLDGGVIQVTKLVEKPGRVAAGSNHAAVGGYLLTPDVFKYLESGMQSAAKAGREFVAVDYLLQPMVDDGLSVLGNRIVGRRYDTGNPLDYVKTVINFALARDDIGAGLRQYLQEFLQ